MLTGLSGNYLAQQINQKHRSWSWFDGQTISQQDKEVRDRERRRCPCFKMVALGIETDVSHNGHIFEETDKDGIRIHH